MKKFKRYKSKFRKGERLILIDDRSLGAQKGAEAICMNNQSYTMIFDSGEIMSTGRRLVEVRWIRNKLSGNQMNGGYFEDTFISAEKNDKSFLNL